MFESIVANNNIKAELSRQITSGKTFNAYLICGAEGSGKTALAEAFASLLADGKQDIKTIKKPADKDTIPIDTLREMKADVFLSPTGNGRKVYIIDGMQYVDERSQNTLLTILEQPPLYAVFLLLSTGKGEVLPTVISRCVCYDMETVDKKAGADFLHKRHPEIPYDKLLMTMSAASGIIGVAERYAEGDLFEKRIVLCEKLTRSIAYGQEYPLALTLHRLNKNNFGEFVSFYVRYLRDVLVYETTKSVENTTFSESVLKNREVFDTIDINTLYTAIGEFENALVLLAKNVGKELIASGVTVRIFGGY